jgi:hypothetical protein
MFKGESSVKFKSEKPIAEVFSQVEDTLQPLGRVQINNRGVISAVPKDKYQSFLTDTTIEGDVRKEKTSGEYTLTIKYDCSPSAMNWVITIGGLLCLWTIFRRSTCPFRVPIRLTRMRRAKGIDPMAEKLNAM